jgi:hypothetical protein
MTEQDWLACTFSTPLFEVLRKRHASSWRKRFLLSLACCHRVAPLMSEEGRRAVAVAMRFGEGLATETERWEAFAKAGRAMDEAEDQRQSSADWCAYRLLQLAAEQAEPATWDDDTAAQIAQVASEPFAWTGSGWDSAVLQAQRIAIAELVRDIFGNPIRPTPAIESSWLAWKDGTVKRLAKSVYEEGTFDRMPVLADALEEAGCHDQNILEHCRQQGQTHVRGCWVVDLLLGRT